MSTQNMYSWRNKKNMKLCCFFLKKKRKNILSGALVGMHDSYKLPWGGWGRRGNSQNIEASFSHFSLKFCMSLMYKD